MEMRKKQICVFCLKSLCSYFCIFFQCSFRSAFQGWQQDDVSSERVSEWGVGVDDYIALLKVRDQLPTTDEIEWGTLETFLFASNQKLLLHSLF